MSRRRTPVPTLSTRLEAQMHDLTAPRRRAYPFRTVAPSTRDASGDRLWIEGYASVWGSRNSFGECFVPGAYTNTLAAKSDEKPLVMGYLHRDVIGRWQK